MTFIKKAGIIALFILTGVFAFADDIEKQGQTILDQADKRFYPVEGSMKISLNAEGMDGRKEFRLECYKKGSLYQTVVFVSPTINKNNVGMRSGNTIYWKEAKWPKSNIMSYQATFADSTFSFGDILTGDMALYYKANKLEKIKENGKEVYYIVVEPKNKGLYARVDTWIDATTFDTLKRVYFSASGEKMKSAEYTDIILENNTVKGFSIQMQDFFAESKSFIEIQDIIKESLPNFLFNPMDIGRIHTK